MSSRPEFVPPMLRNWLAMAAYLVAAAPLALASPTPAQEPAAMTTEVRSSRNSSPRPEPEPDTLYAPHGTPGRFFHPWTVPDRGFFDLVRWQLSSNPYDKRRKSEIPVVANDGSSLLGAETGASVTWVGHATFAVHDETDVFLTDPHFGDRALILGRHVPPGIPLESVPLHAFAVLSHNHYDHLDAGTVEALPAGMAWFVPLGMADWFRRRGRSNVVELDWWQSARHGRFTITCVPVQHWSMRIEQSRNSALWCGWVVDSGERRYFFSGDTGYFHGFREIGRRFGPIDVAMLPIGAFEPRWFMKHQHMDPADAWQAFLDLGARWMLPMHWGTFDLTDEPLDEAPRELARAITAAGGDDSAVKLMAIGERWKVPAPLTLRASAEPETSAAPLP